MTKFEAIIRLAVIKGQLKERCTHEEVLFAVCILLDDLSEEFLEEHQEDCEGCGCASHDRCHNCGQFH